MNYIFLSHVFTENMPSYGKNVSVDVKAVRSLSAGDSCNVCSIALENHWGTHIDAPNHFFNDGKKITDYSADFFAFNSPQIIKVDLSPEEILECSSWIECIKKDSDMLLFQSGWSNKIGEVLYTNNNPGISPEVGLYLRKNFPNIRAVGMDWISVSCFQKRDLGRKAHKAFLDPSGENNPILLIEDMDLSGNLDNLINIVVAPLLINSIDSAPCTVIGGLSD